MAWLSAKLPLAPVGSTLTGVFFKRSPLMLTMYLLLVWLTGMKIIFDA